MAASQDWHNGGTRCAGEANLARLGLLAPLVLLADLGLLFWREVVDDVEGFPDLLGCLSLDHGGNLGAGEVEQWLDVHVVSGEDELEEGLLLEVDEVGVPRGNNLFKKRVPRLGQ